MAGKSSLIQFQNIRNGDMSGSITSRVTGVQYLDNIAIQLNVTTADAVGTFEVQVSLDYAQDSQGNVTNAGNWIGLNLSGTPTVASTNEQFFIDINQVPAPWVRVVYTRTSGTGTVQGFISAKDLS